jgi:hypothetical protein
MIDHVPGVLSSGRWPSCFRTSGWAWQTDRHVFSKTLAIFHRALETAMSQEIGPPELVLGIETALRVGLSDSEIREVLES